MIDINYLFSTANSIFHILFHFQADYNSTEVMDLPAAVAKGRPPARAKKSVWSENFSMGTSTGTTAEERDTNFKSMLTWKILPVGRLAGIMTRCNLVL